LSRQYSIRELTKELGITARTLRHYEDEGLIAPTRNGQQRIYSTRDRARITLILRGRRVGFTLAEIGEILDLYDSEDGGAAQLAYARKKFASRIAALEQQRRDVEESLAELRLGLTAIETKLADDKPRTSPRLTGFGVMPLED
jgi:DNA-binding transcriptional MerR regulator